MANKNLNAAKTAKKDEFYTQLVDIENELKHYRQHFRGKTILCNCDDPYESNFFKYFANNFNAFGLRKLICTCYNGSPVIGTELPLFALDEEGQEKRVAYKVEITEVTDANGDGRIDLADVRYLIQNDKNVLSVLKENGDFRSRECKELLKEADIVVTNPPFSLFREYVAQLVEYDKKFIILGNKNAVTYKEIFPLIKENKMWIGYTPMSREIYFDVPAAYIEEGLALNKDRSIIRHNNKYMARSQSIWFTNLDHKKRHEELVIFAHYNEEDYPKYDNYDAINVDKTSDIPCDYNDIMGVPISFLDKYNPEQFDVVGVANHGQDNIYDLFAPKINGKQVFKRILIRKKQ